MWDIATYCVCWWLSDVHCDRSVTCVTLVSTVIASNIDKEHGKSVLFHGIYSTATILGLIAIVNRLSHQLSDGVNNFLRILIGWNCLRWLESHLALRSILRPPATTKDRRLVHSYGHSFEACMRFRDRTAAKQGGNMISREVRILFSNTLLKRTEGRKYFKHSRNSLDLGQANFKRYDFRADLS